MVLLIVQYKGHAIIWARKEGRFVSDKKLKIMMFSSADSVSGQGVSSAYREQVALVKETCKDVFDVKVNEWNEKADIQHFHTIDPIFLFKMQKKKPLNVAYCHFLPDTVTDGSLKIPKIFVPIFSKYVIYFYNKADELVVVNPSFIKQLEHWGIKKEKITYIPNFVSKEKFHPLDQTRKDAFRKKHGIEKDAFVVLGAGQVQTRKGVQDFVKVAKEMPDITFVWAGGFSFGRMTEGYEELEAIMKHPPENVKFLGIVERDEMVDVYNMANVLFIPSYNELFPMTILESANIGVPLVIRDLELYEDILFDHYLKGKNNEEFVSLLRALNEDKALYKKYAKESLAISEFYSKEHVSDMWRSFYRKAYDKKHNK
jgi:1,2-diacylglycerol-3-alpha-glucose alpha-1,2-galactosyltransferase